MLFVIVFVAGLSFFVARSSNRRSALIGIGRIVINHLQLNSMLGEFKNQ